MTLPPLLIASTGLGAASTGTPFHGDPPDEHHPWAIHDRNRPQPKRVEPGTFSSAAQPGKPPSDAVVLFDGTEDSLAKWEADTKPGDPLAPTKWIVSEGAMECVPKSGYIRTKEQFGDCQLHVEWAAPRNVLGDSQGRGNSGIFLMGLCEVQVLDNYNNPTYADGFAASVYGVNPPMANALHAPGEFQSIDVVFRRPVYQGGKVVDPGYVTVFCNGVLVQDHTPLEGPTGHLRRTSPRAFPEKGPLKLQDHGNPVRFRNIWYRPLPPRSTEGGTEGVLTAEATTARRKEIAAALRGDAGKLKGNPTAEMLRLAESLVYEKDSKVAGQVVQMADRYAASVKSLSGGELENRKGEMLEVLRSFKYLVKWNLVPAGFAPLGILNAIEKAQGWETPKK
ncbi:MAG: 3-keto-disaccharide hydrolase [Opitutaceae bacterium]